MATVQQWLEAMSLMRRTPRKWLWLKCFTLLELLVVIGIIAILMSILMPALKTARGEANSVVCKGNLRQIGQTMQLYIDDYDGYFPCQYATTYDNWDTVFAVRLYNCSPIVAKNGKLCQPELNHVFGCPSAIAFHPKRSESRTYSMNGFIGFNTGGTTSRPKINMIESPSGCCFAGDGYPYPSSTTNWCTVMNQSNFYPELVHKARGNYVFCDGHVEALLPSRSIVSTDGVTFWYGKR